MPRLLRIHFSSIGHRDARLAPLTIDFRDTEGRAADSVLWLRNGGGKSSIINLFFSIFRPQRRDFLGAAAEGKARRIEDYVKAKDLALAVTEWDLGDDESGKARRCLVGRVMGWKGQTRSADPANLRRLFFTLSFSEGDAHSLGLEDLPILGLGEPVATFDGFRDWLRELANQRPAAQVVFTDNLRKWNEHLERLGLDPELFRYQLRMNLREGAADEAFRFGTALEFVNFLLELAFDTQHANQVAKNLEELRDQFARRPALELERAFIADALGALQPLVSAVKELARSQEARDRSVTELATLSAGLRGRAGALEQEAASARQQADGAAEEARFASNERDKRNRWARGLEHLAAELAALERRALRDELDEKRGLVRQEIKVLEAAQVRRDLDRLEARLDELRESLRRAQEELAPERERLELAGAALHAALVAEQDRLEALLDDMAGRIGVAKKTCAAKQERIEALRAEVARLEERIAGLKRTIRGRDTAREKLQRDGCIDRREAVDAALARWEASADEARHQREQLRRERDEGTRKLDENRARQRVVTGELARFEEQLTSATSELERALSWRQAMMQKPCIIEVEAVDEPDLESLGLEQRLRSKASAAANAVLEARVDGAEDERSLAAIEATGLLPPTRDVERVMECLRERSLNVHAGPAFLAANAGEGDRLAHIQAHPARFGGVLVVASELPADMAEATRRLDLRSPVQVSAVGQALAPAPPGDGTVHVVPPSPASYDLTRAEAVRVALQERRETRNRQVAEWSEQRREYEVAADELQRYLEAYGRGRLDALQQSCDAAREQAAGARAELDALGAQESAQQETLARIDTQLEEWATALGRAELALATLRLFWEQHEATIDATRAELDASEKRTRDAERELAGTALAELERARMLLETLTDERKDRQRDQHAITREAGEIEYRAEDREDLGAPLEHARDRYRHLLADWTQQSSDNRLQWQIEETSQQAKPLRDTLALMMRELAGEPVSELATEADLEERIAEARRSADLLQERRANAHASLEQAERELEESRRRRDARDLPPESDERSTPTVAAAARAEAEEMRVAMQSHGEAARRAEERERNHRAEAVRQGQASERYQAAARNLDTLAEGAGLTLPNAASMAALPERFEAVEARLAEARSRFSDARSRVAAAERSVQGRADSVRAVATARRFSELKSQARERMNAETGELTAECEHLATKLAPRLEVIDERLTELDKDRRILVDALQDIGAKAGSLLQRAQRASTLPTTLGAWAGKPYLRMRFQFPDTDEEQRARLEPLVDRLVARAQIPDGLELVKLAVAELAGTRGFEAKVLKPDAVLRPDPISITAMNTFSRGQQLTAAILLYCTLVQLRARNRGRGAGAVDAGILLLDNPIGTCSSVPLLELQRTIARSMRVQLIYATGVDDLEALETLPNKIRLRNTMRDRSSGDFHVSHEAHVEAVRVATASA